MRRALRETLQAVTRAVNQFVRDRGLQQSQTGYSIDVTAAVAIAQTSLSVAKHGDVHNYVAYQVQARGSSELVVSADGIDIWRGQAADEALEQAVTLAAAQAFLASQDEP